MIFQLMFIGIHILIGENSWISSKKIIEENATSTAEFDYEIAQALFPVCKVIMIASNPVRFLLFLVSFKWPKVCKIFLAFEITTSLIDQGLIRNQDYATMNYIKLLQYFLLYVTLSYNMTSSSIMTFVGQIGFQVIQMVMYKQDKAVVGISLLINLPILIFALCTIQISLTWAGFMFADAEILRNGNE